MSPVSGILIYCDQRATEPNALGKGMQLVLETWGFEHEVVTARKGMLNPLIRYRDEPFRAAQ